MEMHTSSTPAPTGPRASQLGTTASLLRPGGAVTVSAASDGGRAPVVLAAGADPARDRHLDRQLHGVLAELRARRRRRRAREAERARRERERTAEHALLLSGPLHVR